MVLVSPTDDDDGGDSDDGLVVALSRLPLFCVSVGVVAVVVVVVDDRTSPVSSPCPCASPSPGPCASCESCSDFVLASGTKEVLVLPSYTLLLLLLSDGVSVVEALVSAAPVAVVAVTFLLLLLLLTPLLLLLLPPPTVLDFLRCNTPHHASHTASMVEGATPTSAPELRLGADTPTLPEMETVMVVRGDSDGGSRSGYI